ncbi:metalloregulator ArsR/SmtB family transcription factor [Alisedimentitalea sp. MJ-SS2]|uniref:ArsR/SmtB family transcription factor n=1 Tax=Aliisedimentitalea sp. MJ-SS2 TaxID=3049795 RepID=UPI0029076FE0|nr:metalloregulator ArsR/SmtB family transcription factor [Alisedimentitalea sp. MJ-SS2]MDU8929408.1 metalloregulator ArsR/SmtB family transcription factor [Alisedimentitalea sp. MJ-SS2]
MDMIRALDAFTALSQETRLRVFRHLVRAGAQGMVAGDLARALDVKQNTLSANLAVLLRAGIVRNRREGRSIRYFVDLDGLRGMLSFLLEDCCGGQAEICTPVIESIACNCEGTCDD